MNTLVTMFGIVLALLLQSEPARRTFSGVVADSECSDSDHGSMRMGSTAAECAKACMDTTRRRTDSTRPLRASLNVNVRRPSQRVGVSSGAERR